MLPGGIEEDEIGEFYVGDYQKHLDLLLNFSLI